MKTVWHRPAKTKVKKEDNTMAITMFIIILLYLVICALYQICKGNYLRVIVYVALFILIFLFFKDGKYTLLIDSRLSDVSEIIVDGFNQVIKLLIAFYLVITALLILFIRCDCSSQTFLCTYFLLAVIKLSFLLYNTTSLLIMGVISIAELLSNPVIGSLAYNQPSKCIDHLTPYLAELKKAGWFGIVLFLSSLGISIISIVYICIS